MTKQLKTKDKIRPCSQPVGGRNLLRKLSYRRYPGADSTVVKSRNQGFEKDNKTNKEDVSRLEMEQGQIQVEAAIWNLMSLI